MKVIKAIVKWYFRLIMFDYMLCGLSEYFGNVAKLDDPSLSAFDVVSEAQTRRHNRTKRNLKEFWKWARKGMGL